MDKLKKEPHYVRLDRPVFIIAVICCLIFYVPLIIFQNDAQPIVQQLMTFVSDRFDWLFESICFICLLFALWLIFGRYGKVKLGDREDKPEFSNFTWIALFFCAGIGAGAIYWACLEPLYYTSAPPFGLAAFSTEAREWTMAYTFFHWGLTPWAIFAVPALAFAYNYYNNKNKYFKASNACSGAIGKYAYGKWGTVIDIVVIIGMLGGLATSLGFVFPMLSGLISQYLGIADTLSLQVGIGAFFTLVFGYSCYRGLYSGIAKLSNINMVMFMFLIAFIFIVGPSLWTLSYFFDSLGILFQNFIRMSFFTDSIANSGFPETWTVFYWAWWLAWAIYIGLFMARISKGRTIRAFLANMLFVAGGGTVLMFAVIGSYGQHVFFERGVDLLTILADQGGPAAIYALLDTLPLAKVFIPLFVVILLVAQATGIDSAAYTLANISCKEIQYQEEPRKWLRVFWALFIFFATLALLLVGGMEVVKLSSILTSIPILALQVIFMISVIKWLRRDIGPLPVLYSKSRQI